MLPTALLLLLPLLPPAAQDARREAEQALRAAEEQYGQEHPAVVPALRRLAAETAAEARATAPAAPGRAFRADLPQSVRRERVRWRTAERLLERASDVLARTHGDTPTEAGVEVLLDRALMAWKVRKAETLEQGQEERRADELCLAALAAAERLDAPELRGRANLLEALIAFDSGVPRRAWAPCIAAFEALSEVAAAPPDDAGRRASAACRLRFTADLMLEVALHLGGGEYDEAARAAREEYERELLPALLDLPARPAARSATNALPERAAALEFFVYRPFRVTQRDPVDGDFRTAHFSALELGAWLTERPAGQAAAGAPQRLFFGPLAELEDETREYVAALSAGDAELARELGARIAARLEQGLEGKLTAGRVLVVVPAACLSVLPLGRLPWSPERTWEEAFELRWFSAAGGADGGTARVVEAEPTQVTHTLAAREARALLERATRARLSARLVPGDDPLHTSLSWCYAAPPTELRTAPPAFPARVPAAVAFADGEVELERLAEWDLAKLRLLSLELAPEDGAPPAGDAGRRRADAWLRLRAALARAGAAWRLVDVPGAGDDAELRELFEARLRARRPVPQALREARAAARRRGAPADGLWMLDG